MTKVTFTEPGIEVDSVLTYSVIAARYKDEWLFVRHCKRTTWEIPGGHIEPDEIPEDTARRELAEETGAIDPEPEAVSDYSVTKGGLTGYGRLFFAEISGLDQLSGDSEICEVQLLDRMPDNLTYPDIQPILFEKVISWLRSRGRL